MRHYANRIGWSLSDKSLEVVLRTGKGKDRVRTPLGKFVKCHSEGDIFGALGLEYREPNERNCYENPWTYSSIEEFQEESMHMDM